MNHLDEVGLSRKEHFFHALKLAGTLAKIAGALLIHSIAPRYFTKYYSTRIEELTNK